MFPSGIRFGLFPFRSLLLGESLLVSFPPPTKMLPFGGFPLPYGSISRKSHSGIPGSKAACAYPGRYRGLPRPSSALKPSHPPDGVCVVGLFGGIYWRLVNTFLLVRRCFLPVCGVILSFSSLLRPIHRFTPASLLVRSCISFYIAYSMLLNCFRSEFR
jgi:hypothetical protein